MQTLIVTAYKDEDQLLRLVRQFEDRFNVYVHLDRRSKAFNRSNIDSLGFRNLHICSTHAVAWGAIDHLQAILDMLKMAVADSRASGSYVHVVSGQDIALHSVKWFERRFDADEHLYLNYHFAGGELERWHWYFPTTRVNLKNKWVSRAQKASEIMQRWLRLSRKGIGEFSANQIYEGLVWCSLPYSACKYAVEYADQHPEFLRTLSHMRVPEEYFFQTILLNSPFKAKIVNDYIRYMDWKTTRGGSAPATLDVTDIVKAYPCREAGEYAFARKIDSRISAEFIFGVEERIARERSALV